MYLKGVNLGNWLVLEKWMQPSMFRGTKAEDEYYLATELPRETYLERIRNHRREYITERDFLRIRKMGFNSVRIPVPYFIFGDRAPFVGCVEELDDAFCWAEKYGLMVLIDLHTCPDSQNGFDNGGISGVCKWWKEPEEVDFELTVLERLAQRYGRRKSLWGIEVLNEPVLDDMWEIANIQQIYHPADPEKAAGSGGMTKEFLNDFYRRAYEVLRRYLPDEKYIVFHDAFHFDMWRDFVQETGFKSVALDTHMYLTVAEMMGLGRTVEDYEGCIRKWKEDIAALQPHIPVIVGEWCLAHNVEAVGDMQRALYKILGEQQLDAWKGGFGHFYWSYKLMLDVSADSDQEKLECWDLERSIDHGWIPEEEMEPVYGQAYQTVAVKQPKID